MPETRPTLRLGSDAASLAEAGRLLAHGALVAFPTETVYGLGADATNSAAIARLYAAKGRPSFNPLIAHVPDLASAFALGTFDADARKLAETFWPGPLTLVVPARQHGPVCELARAGLPSLAIRVPADETARAILQAAGKPVAAPSANRSGHVSPTEAAHVLADLDGRIDAVVEGNPAIIGLESTILACLDGRVILLRPGAITREAAEAVIHRQSKTLTPTASRIRSRPAASRLIMRLARPFVSTPKQSCRAKPALRLDQNLRPALIRAPRSTCPTGATLWRPRRTSMRC